jgi:hypothetical protein
MYPDVPLISWPHLPANGRDRCRGVEHPLAVTEPAAGNALPGPTRWADRSPRKSPDQQIILGYVRPPGPGRTFLATR